MIMELFQKREIGEKQDYRIFEALRDVKRVVDVYDTTHSQIAVILPPVWLLQQKMWEPLLAILCVYLITFSVNIFLFILAVILVALYFRKGQVTLRRSYGMFQDRQVWAIIAARSNKEAQEMCRNIDEKVNFVDVLKSTFPMGSMTGAPKLRAMELIEDFEDFKRGFFSGAVGYITPQADFDFNVVIRTILYNLANNYLSIAVGGAITIKSDSIEEYNECLIKSKPLFDVLNFKLDD